MKLPRICIPPEVQAQADAAQKRLDDALDAMLGQLKEYLPGEDDFHQRMSDLIDADKNVVRMIDKRKAR